MNDPFIPWWLALLLGMWSVAFTLWVRPNVNREARLWSGLATLVYLALIFLALRVNPRQDIPLTSRSTISQVADFGFGVCLAVSLAASIYSLGQVSLLCRRAGYLVHTLANACICALLQQPEVAFGLLIVAGVVACPLVRKFSMPISTSVREWLMSAARFDDKPDGLGRQGGYWLVGVLVGLLAFTSFGTISYALRSEMSHIASSPHHTALPTRDRLNEVLVNRNNPDRVASPLNLALGRRSDIPVLMTVIVFLYLAMSMGRASGESIEGARTVEVPTGNSPESLHEH